MDESGIADSKLLRRHNHLITAFRRAAHNHGWELEIVAVPDSSSFPFVLMCAPTADAEGAEGTEKELLFLFAAHDTFVQSNVISDIVRQMGKYQEEVTEVYIFFDEKVKPNVESVMRVSGLTSHTKVLYFRRVEGEALFDWSPGRKVLVPSSQVSNTGAKPLFNDQL